MWLMLQQDDPQDFVIATGVAHAVSRCLEIAFDQAGVSVDDHVEFDEALVRPAEIDHLIGTLGRPAVLGLGARDEFRAADPADGRR